MSPIPVPQLMKSAPMTIVTYQADYDALREILPPGLDPHPDGRVVLNMWDQDDPGSSSGFGSPGPVSVTYLAIEVAGYDTFTADGSVSAPGRYFAGHWISEADGGGFRLYGTQEAGVGSTPGETIYDRSGSSLAASLVVNGTERIRLSATVGDQLLVTLGGHLNYFCDRPSDVGTEIARISVPFVFELYSAEVTDIRFVADDGFRLLGGRPAIYLGPTAPLTIGSVMSGRASWAPFRVVETWQSC